MYSDGSGYNNEVGAAAVMYKKGRLTHTDQRQYYIGPRKEHNMYEAEIIGTIIGIWMISILNLPADAKVSLYTDNSSLVKAVKKDKSTSGQHLVKQLREAANNIRCKLTIIWISGHSEVIGNEKADGLAKQATERKSSRMSSLPPSIRKGVPSSISAEKENFHKHLLRDWQEHWHDSPRRERFLELEENVPFQKYQKLQDKLTREQASKIMQIRSRHIPLNTYLHRIGKAGSRKCPKCECTAGEEAAPETVSHFIFECPAYEDEQWELGRALGRRDLNLKNLMSSEKGLRALTKFIAKTGRFNKRTDAE